MFSPIQVDAISKLDRCMHYLVEFCIWIYIYIYVCVYLYALMYVIGYMYLAYMYVPTCVCTHIRTCVCRYVGM